MNFQIAVRRLPLSLLAASAGWAAAILVTTPLQVAKIVESAVGPARSVVLSFVEGFAVWALWCFAIAVGGWLLGFIPILLFVPERWLLRYRKTTVVSAALLGLIVVLLRFQVWELVLPYRTLPVRMFTLYTLVLVTYTAAAAAVYLRLISARRISSW